MYALFGKVTPYIKAKPRGEVPRPDNLVFKLHYKMTFSIIAVACILVSTYSYIDKSEAPIQCLIDKGVGVPEAVINRYCWIMSTFTLPKHFTGVPGKDILHHGVGTHKDDDERKYHAYYQWVPLVLAIQAIMFYFPHWLWKTLEGGRMKNIIIGLNAAIDDEDSRQTKVGPLAEYMKIRGRDTTEHQIWASKFFFCEVLNFINVIAQIFITDSFLGGEFTQFGTEVLNFPNVAPEDRVDPMSRIFPRMTKCIFHKYGGSGTIQRFDALCVLSMNIVNEKIYIFLWFWFIILSVVTGLHLLLRVVQLFMPNVRDRLVQLQNLGYVEQNNYRSNVEMVIRSVSYSDWLILYYLAQSMDKANFVTLVKKMADDIPQYEDENDGEKSPDLDDDDDLDSKKKVSRNSTLRSSNKLQNMLPMVRLQRDS